MQTQLPFFPSDTKLINASVGFRKQDGFVYYMHNGNPVYCHEENDRNSYRFIMGSMINNQLCTIRELSEATGEHRKNIERYSKSLRDHGPGYFFSRKETRGQCYKMTEQVLSEVQSLLDKGYSKYRISKELSVSESAISYHEKKGSLHIKKSIPR
jgi:biotin operon repressor